MGEPLQNLEERLERLVPRGLSDDGEARLHSQIDDLAAGAQGSVRSGGRRRAALGIAAAAAAIAGVVIFTGPGNGEEGSAAAAKPGPAPAPATSETAPDAGFQMVDFERRVGDGEYGGIVLDRFDEPMHSWNHEVREMELFLDAESGLRVRIVQERREQVRVAVTSF